MHNHDDASFQNKGAPRDAIGIDTSHPTRLLSVEYEFSKARDDDRKYEREA